MRDTNERFLQDHVLLKMPAFEGYGCHAGLPEKGLRLTHPAICDRTLKFEFLGHFL